MVLNDSDELTQLASHLEQEMLLLLSLSHRQETKTQRASIPIQIHIASTGGSQGLNLDSLAPETLV